MADLNTLIGNMARDGYFRTLAANPRAQFGTGPRRYIGAELLPEQMKEDNSYREIAIRYRTIVANAGTRYSPAQKKGGDLTGEFKVELAESDILREFTARDYDALRKMYRGGQDMQAMAAMMNFVDMGVNRALIETNEVWRWQAIVSAAVTLSGDNGYSETVSYSNPAGHRFNATGTWSNNSFDPHTDIIAGAELLASKGYTVSRIIAPRPVLSIMSMNNNVRTRTGIATISPTGQITATGGRATFDAINTALSRDGLPAVELYDLQYRTQTGTGYFLPRNVFVMVATTGQSDMLDMGDNQRILEDTLGYTGVGIPAGQDNPGRVIKVKAFEDEKPPRIVAQGWQTSLPVITEPEGICVIGAIA